MDKLDLKTLNFTDKNIQKLSELFPNCVTEDSEGKKIDFDKLKQELSENIIDDSKECYELSWPGKAASVVAANTPINKTLRPNRVESKDFDNTENLYIEGDNLEALKLLQETYLGKVKMIYIDPPYNTGKDFIYKDNFTQDKAEYDEESGNVDDEGGRLITNPDSNGRIHSDWLSMMYSRLKLAKNLLKDDGVIFISIDDNEAHNLRKICDEIIGENNFCAEFVWQKNFAPKNDNKYISISHETILCFAKNKIKFNRNLLPREEKHNKGYSNPDNDSRGDWTSGTILATTFSKTGVFEITSPNGLKHTPPNGQCWRYSESKILELLKDNKLWFGKDGNGVPRVKRFLSDMPQGIVPQSWLKYEDVGSGQDGTQLVKSIFGNSQIFSFPKPISLLKRFLHIGMNKEDIVLDFFSGSSSTAHATMKLNSEDNGNRKFIMVQLPEETDKESEAYKTGYKTISEIGKERIRRAGKQIIKETGNTNLDVGFRVLKVDSSNMKDVYFTPDETKQDDMLDLADNIKDGRTDEDLLFMVLLNWGIELSAKIERKKIAGKEVFFVDDNFLAACFEEEIDENFIKALVDEKPRKVVLKDSSFASSSAKINVKQIFEQDNIESKVI